MASPKGSFISSDDICAAGLTLAMRLYLKRNAIYMELLQNQERWAYFLPQPDLIVHNKVSSDYRNCLVYIYILHVTTLATVPH